MTESAFLPLFLLALWAFARALETPTLVWQLASVVASARGRRDPPPGPRLAGDPGDGDPRRCACAAGGSGRSRARSIGSRLRSFTATGVALLAGALAFVAYALVGGGVSGVFGGYRDVLDLEYSLAEGLRWTVFHAAELVFAVGILPAAAFLAPRRERGCARAAVRPSARSSA